MITVVHLITDLNVGGAERQLVELVKHSDRQLFRHVVVSMLDFGPLGAEAATAGVEVRTLGMRPGTPSLGGLISLVKLLRQVRPDILQCWMYHANLLGAVAGKLVGVPHTIWCIRFSDPGSTSYGRLTRWVVRMGAWLSRYPDVIVFNSKVAKSAHQGCDYSGSRMVVIPNGFNLEIFKPDPTAYRSVRGELGLADDTFLIGMIARFHSQKDHGTFFRAAGLLSKRMPGVRFLLAGAGVSANNPELLRMVSENALEGLVHLMGLRYDIPRLTAALDIASLSSSFGEAFPCAVGEAMACGVPCVVTDVGDSAYLVGDTGLVIPRKDPEALAAAWAKVLEMGWAGRQALGERARQRIIENFRLDKIVFEYESLYESLYGNITRPVGALEGCA